MAVALVMMMAACGGGDDDTTPDTGPAGTQATTTTRAAGSSSGGGGSEDGGNYAIVTVGGTTYEVPPDALNLCNSLDKVIFGSLAVNAGGTVTSAGGTDVAVQVNFGIPVPAWDEEGLQAPLLDVDDRTEGVRWWASVGRGLGSVDSWDLTGGKATGEATFVGEQAGTGNQVGTEPGTFEVVCR